MDNRMDRKIDTATKEADDRAQIAEGKTKLAYHQTEDKVRDMGDDMKEGFDHAADVTKDKAHDMKENIKESWEEGKEKVKDWMDDDDKKENKY